MYSLSFYVFSLFISYSDWKTFRIPNTIIYTMSFFLVVFGILENRLTLSSFIMPILILLLFISLILIFKNSSIGGGDIKYYVVIALYLDYFSFFVFLIIAGVLQTMALLIKQKIQNRRFVAMAPFIFLAVIMTEILNLNGVLPRVN